MKPEFKPMNPDATFEFHWSKALVQLQIRLAVAATPTEAIALAKSIEDMLWLYVHKSRETNPWER